MNKTKAYTLKINESIEQTLIDFSSRLKKGEKIVSTTLAGDNVIIVIEQSMKNENLLLG